MRPPRCRCARRCPSRRPSRSRRARRSTPSAAGTGIIRPQPLWSPTKIRLSARRARSCGRASSAAPIRATAGRCRPRPASAARGAIGRPTVETSQRAGVGQLRRRRPPAVRAGRARAAHRVRPRGVVRGEAAQLGRPGREAGVGHPERLEDPLAQHLGQRRARDPLDQHAGHRRAGVVAPARSPGWSSSGRLAEPGDPLVGGEIRGGHGGPSVLRPSSCLGPLDRVGAGDHDRAEAEVEGQHVLDGDGPLGRDRVVELGVQGRSTRARPARAATVRRGRRAPSPRPR